MIAILLRLGSALLLVGALALFVLAFTRFDAGGPPQPGSPGSADYEERLTRDAQLSVGLGVAGCFTLLGAFACHKRAGRKPAASTSQSMQDLP